MTGSGDGIPNEGSILFSFGVGEKGGQNSAPGDIPRAAFVLTAIIVPWGYFRV